MIQKKEFNLLLYITLAILVLILSIFNLKNIYRKPIQVLGATDDSGYWQELTQKNPTYIDGWIELGRWDKVKEIDPNY